MIAFCHWGREWSFQPDPSQQQAAYDLVDAGFDLVVGSHGHVLQGPEVYRNRLIAYSLGTLVSDFRPLKTRTSALLEVEITAGTMPRVTRFNYIPTLVEGTPRRITVLGTDEKGAERQQARALARRVLGTALRD